MYFTSFPSLILIIFYYSTSTHTGLIPNQPCFHRNLCHGNGDNASLQCRKNQKLMTRGLSVQPAKDQATMKTLWGEVMQVCVCVCLSLRGNTIDQTKQNSYLWMWARCWILVLRGGRLTITAVLNVIFNSVWTFSLLNNVALNSFSLNR